MIEGTIEEQVGEYLRQLNMKLVIAESCTGGLIGHRITNIPGSSEYYLGSITAYAYEAKERLLGVQHTTLQRYGAVSRETVLEMAAGVRNVFSVDFPENEVIGISVSGIAGPGGGMPGKPVGLVWIGLSSPRQDWAGEFHFHGSRIDVKNQTADTALTRVLEYLRSCASASHPEAQEKSKRS